jgi:hypothetical protein
MNTEYRIPTDDQFVADLILQRTGPFIAMGGGEALNRWFLDGNRAALVDYLRSRNLTKRYIQEVLTEVGSEANKIYSLLSVNSLDRIVSIGPGNGLFELMLLRRGLTSKILLIDIEHTADHHHGFNHSGAGYAALASTKSFMIDNGIPSEKILLCNPTKEPMPVFQFSLMISLLSMGFHYPCNDYSDFIESNSSLGSILILDKRKGVSDPGFERLISKFDIQQRSDAQKSVRMMLKKHAC